MKTIIIVAAAAVACGLAAGCGPQPNSLEGSISESHDLHFDEVELRFFTDQSVYQLSYFNSLDKDDPTAGKDTVAKITFDEPEGGVKVDAEIDLKADAEEARIERVTAKNDVFPTDFDKGVLTFHTKAEAKKTVSGEFAVTFNNGKTLDGTFETKLENASFD
jgi:hypothetical protein